MQTVDYVQWSKRGLSSIILCCTYETVHFWTCTTVPGLTLSVDFHRYCGIVHVSHSYGFGCRGPTSMSMCPSFIESECGSLGLGLHYVHNATCTRRDQDSMGLVHRYGGQFSCLGPMGLRQGLCHIPMKCTVFHYQLVLKWLSVINLPKYLWIKSQLVPQYLWNLLV